MSREKKFPPTRSRRQRNPAIMGAIARGRLQAAGVATFRAAQRRKRAHAIAAMPARRRGMRPPSVPAKTLRGLGPAMSAGLLVAEGDSWFDYPMHDVLRLLEDESGYDVESVAHKGDTIEDMAYSGGQFEEFARRLEKLLRQQRIPDAILISGGGNDIAGDEFAILLNHAVSGLPALNQDVVRGLIDVRLRNAYAFLVGGLTELSVQYLGKPIPILTHGYDYPVPDGRGFLGGWGPLPGPWLQPGFHRKGHADRAMNTQVMHNLIDAFNTMLQEVSSEPQFRHVRFVDLRNTLSSDEGYRRDWANELHPTGRGFSAVAAKFAAMIASL